MILFWPKPREYRGLGQRLATELFTDYLNHYFTMPGMIQLNEEYALIGTELHRSVHHWHSFTCAE